MATQTSPSVWHQVTRLLAGLLEIINIITCVPIAAFTYIGMLERLREFESLSMAAITGLAVFGAIAAVAFINGGIAVLLCIKHDIRHHTRREQQSQHTAAPMPETKDEVEETATPKTKAKTKKAAPKTRKPKVRKKAKTAKKQN